MRGHVDALFYPPPTDRSVTRLEVSDRRRHVYGIALAGENSKFQHAGFAVFTHADSGLDGPFLQILATFAFINYRARPQNPLGYPG